MYKLPITINIQIVKKYKPDYIKEILTYNKKNYLMCINKSKKNFAYKVLCIIISDLL